jgi:hypothetical protein
MYLRKVVESNLEVLNQLYPDSGEYETALTGSGEDTKITTITRSKEYLKSFVENKVKNHNTENISSAMGILLGLTLSAAAFGVFCILNSEEKPDYKKLPEPTYHSNPLTSVPCLRPNKASLFG